MLPEASATPGEPRRVCKRSLTPLHSPRSWGTNLQTSYMMR